MPEAAGARGQLGSVASVRMQLPFLLFGCSVRERTPLLLLQQEFDNAFLFLSLPTVAYAVCAVVATDGGAGKADTVDWHPNSSNKMLALPGLLYYYPGVFINRGSHSNCLADSCHSLRRLRECPRTPVACKKQG